MYNGNNKKNCQCLWQTVRVITVKARGMLQQYQSFKVIDA